MAIQQCHILFSNFSMYSIISQSFPLYSIIKAVGKTSINYVSLDVEGSEYGIMHSAFKYNDELLFDIATIATTYLGGIFGNHLLEMRYLMKRNGYELHKHIGEDDIFIRKDFNISWN